MQNNITIDGLATVFINTPAVAFVPYPANAAASVQVGMASSWSPGSENPIEEIATFLKAHGIRLESNWPREDVYHYDIRITPAEFKTKFRGN